MTPKSFIFSLYLFYQVVLGFNPRPIIGIITQEFQDTYRDVQVIYPNTEVSTATEYIAASYVKLVESAGARVVPIRYTLSREELLEAFSKVNGVLLPGSQTHIQPGEYYSSGKVLWEYVEKNPDFPVFGICFGMEWLTSLIAGTMDTNSLSGAFSASDVALNVNFTKAANHSQLFKYIFRDEELINAMTSGYVTFNEHEHGVSPEVFFKFPKIYTEFELLATSLDKVGKPFVAAYEGKGKYPNIFGVQFHPEKNLFEWHPGSNFPKSDVAMRVSQAIINAFIERTRTNDNVLVTDPFKESSLLIESTLKTLMAGSSYFQEVYAYFPQRDEKIDRVLDI